MGAASSWGGVRLKRYSVQPGPEVQGVVVVQSRVPRGHAQNRILKGIQLLF